MNLGLGCYRPTETETASLVKSYVPGNTVPEGAGSEQLPNGHAAGQQGADNHSREFHRSKQGAAPAEETEGARSSESAASDSAHSEHACSTPSGAVRNGQPGAARSSERAESGSAASEGASGSSSSRAAGESRQPGAAGEAAGGGKGEAVQPAKEVAFELGVMWEGSQVASRSCYAACSDLSHGFVLHRVAVVADRCAVCSNLSAAVRA